MNRLLCILIAFSGLFGATQASAQTVDRTSIDAARTAWLRTFAAKDTSILRNTTTDNVVAVFTGEHGRTLTGRKAVAEYYGDIFAHVKFDLAMTFESSTLDIHENWALDKGVWGPVGNTLSGQYLILWRRGDDLIWRVAYWTAGDKV